MTHGTLPPLLSNAEVRRRTIELMDRRAQQLADGTTASINVERAEVGRLRHEIERLTAALDELKACETCRTEGRDNCPVHGDVVELSIVQVSR